MAGMAAPAGVVTHPVLSHKCLSSCTHSHWENTSIPSRCSYSYAAAAAAATILCHLRTAIGDISISISACLKFGDAGATGRQL